MFGRKRLTITTYLLAISIFLLIFTADGSSFRQFVFGWGTDKTSAQQFEVSSFRNEKRIKEETAWETAVYVISSPVEGPTIMVIGGIHGDEPAGYLAADSISTWAIDRGTLIVLPRANMPAIAERSRSAAGNPDLNRSFPGNHDSDNPTERLAADVSGIIVEHEPLWVIDLHEALHCERQFPGALGQTFIYPSEGSDLDLVLELLNAVNRTIYSKEQHFLLLRGAAAGSVLETAQLHGAESIIIETCMQMSLDERVKYHRQTVSSLLYLLGITVY